MGFTLDKFLLSFVIFGFALTAVLFVQQDMIDNYELNVTQGKFNDTYNVMNESYGLNIDIKDDMTNATILGTDESWTSMVKNGYKSLRRIITTPFVVTIRILTGITQELGLPSFIMWAVIMAVSIATLMAMIYMLFRFRG